MKLIYRMIHIPELCKNKEIHKPDLILCSGSYLTGDDIVETFINLNALGLLRHIISMNRPDSCFVYQPLKIVDDNGNIEFEQTSADDYLKSVKHQSFEKSLSAELAVNLQTRIKAQELTQSVLEKENIELKAQYERAHLTLIEKERENEKLRDDVESMGASTQTSFVRCKKCRHLHDKGWVCSCGHDGSDDGDRDDEE